MHNNQKQKSVPITTDTKTLSNLWKTKATPQELADYLSVSKNTALRTICRMRALHGTKMFPHRKKAVAEGGYSIKTVLKISALWIKQVPLKDLASNAGLHSVDSVWGTIALLRKNYGEELFPRRK